MYAEQAFASYANAAFNEIRNTPLESLNTAAFRARLGDALRSIAEESGANESNSEDYGRIASVYHVHFLPPCPAESGEGLAEVYTFDGFPGTTTKLRVYGTSGLYLVRNYLTEGQRDALMCQTLTDYINVGNAECSTVTADAAPQQQQPAPKRCQRRDTHMALVAAAAN
ncbi:alkylated DNA repair protein [Babesia caballi]|uniref:Alkylated DNA repair protein n=1 Tax=Babesia caballi TaxID=5871 RepID=A0AAV4LWI9_BABCB|nr:alkylated DNA repair protein [Babesia caballi]